jgi:uncharacterized protein with HEPN domain
MSAEREWKLRIQDILDCIEKITEYTQSMTYEQFRKDDKTIDAVIRNLEVIGEAAGHTPLTLQEKYPDIGWFEMRGMRNIMAHEYFGVSVAIVWRAVIYDLPPLIEDLKQILKEQ